MNRVGVQRQPTAPRNGCGWCQAIAGVSQNTFYFCNCKILNNSATAAGRGCSWSGGQPAGKARCRSSSSASCSGTSCCRQNHFRLQTAPGRRPAQHRSLTYDDLFIAVQVAVSGIPLAKRPWPRYRRWRCGKTQPIYGRGQRQGGPLPRSGPFTLLMHRHNGTAGGYHRSTTVDVPECVAILCRSGLNWGMTEPGFHFLCVAAANYAPPPLGMASPNSRLPQTLPPDGRTGARYTAA